MLAVLVTAAVAIVHWPVLQARAITLDDQKYLTENPLVQHPGWASAGRFLKEVLAPSTVQGYYQPLAIDTGVGRYLYPLEEGGTDEQGADFWLANTKVEGSFSFALELKSVAPVADVRLAGFENEAQVNRLDAGHYQVRLERKEMRLEKDLVFYYRLVENLPGTVEVIAYRKSAEEPGTFMMVLTPGLDLKPLSGGSDFVFVLDVSGSMADKIRTLGDGVSRALGKLNPADRFRIITFASEAKDLTGGYWTASPDKVAEAIQRVGALKSHDSTKRAWCS